MQIGDSMSGPVLAVVDDQDVRVPPAPRDIGAHVKGLMAQAKEAGREASLDLIAKMEEAMKAAMVISELGDAVQVGIRARAVIVANNLEADIRTMRKLSTL